MGPEIKIIVSFIIAQRKVREMLTCKSKMIHSGLYGENYTTLKKSKKT